MLFQLGPYLYSLLITAGWSAIFKKKSSVSIAPAFMAHTLFVILFCLIFHNLTMGVWLGIALAVVVLVFKAITQRNKKRIFEWMNSFWKNGFLLFSIVYFLFVVINYKKVFLEWDEFSHWGIFIKESLNLDDFYYKSNSILTHKDYVPAITIFEVIWCKVSSGYRESRMYVAIQTFMFSMMLPIFDKLKDKKIKFFSIVFAMIIPMLFNQLNGFKFYHSIYTDLPMGIIIFYCLFIAYLENEEFSYQRITLFVATSFLVMTKMTAVIFLPMILFFYFGKCILVNKQRIDYKKVTVFCVMLIAPLIMWRWYNYYAGIYAPSQWGKQTYGDVDVMTLIRVLFDPSNCGIPYVETVQRNYLAALFSRNVLINGSYVVVLMTIFLMFIVLSKNANQHKNKVLYVGIYCMLMSVAYAVIVYLLYVTQFVENEAVNLASFERYMNTVVIAIVFLFYGVFIDTVLFEKFEKSFMYAFIIICVYLFVFNIQVFVQLIPGSFTYDSEKTQYESAISDNIIASTPVDSSVIIIKRGEDSDSLFHQAYYCCPRYIWDIRQYDIPLDDVNNLLRSFDYVFFVDADEEFIKNYSSLFENPEDIENWKTFLLEKHEDKIELK